MKYSSEPHCFNFRISVECYNLGLGCILLYAVLQILYTYNTVHIPVLFLQMSEFNIDPWIEGQPIHSFVAGLSLSKTDGSVIPVANLTEEIEVKRQMTS